MKLYKLTDLLLFWERQKLDDFRVLEAIVHLKQFDKLPEEKKKEIIIDTLRKYGLFETDFEGDRNDFIQKQSDILDKAFREFNPQWFKDKPK